MKVEEIIQRLPFFNDWDKKQIQHSFIASDKIELSDPQHRIILKFLPIQRYPELKQEVQLEKILDQCGFQTDSILEYGMLADIELSYLIKSYLPEHTLSQELSYYSQEDHYGIGRDLGKKMHRLHTKVLQEIEHLDRNWLDDFFKKVNLLRYEYGLLDNKGDLDYLLIDMLDKERYLLHNIILKPIHGHLESKYIRFDEEGRLHLHGMRDLILADPIYDFRHLNHLALKHPCFSRGVVDGYYPQGPPRQFFRLLRFYSGVLILEDLIRSYSEGKSLSEGEDLKRLFDMYGDFSEVVPEWYRTPCIS